MSDTKQSFCEIHQEPHKRKKSTTFCSKCKKEKQLLQVEKNMKRINKKNPLSFPRYEKREGDFVVSFD